MCSKHRHCLVIDSLSLSQHCGEDENLEGSSANNLNNFSVSLISSFAKENVRFEKALHFKVTFSPGKDIRARVRSPGRQACLCHVLTPDKSQPPWASVSLTMSLK